jgi:hypothetical protein
MFDSIFNLIIIFIPMAILIGRFVSRVRSRNNPPPKPPQPYIPVHFEDDDDESEYFAKPKAALEMRKEASRPKEVYPPASALFQAPLEQNFIKSTIPAFDSAPRSAAPKAVVKKAEAPPERKDFVLNLNHLSAMKQAVVMAEILGTPKGLM